MKAVRLRELTNEELDEQCAVARKELFNLQIRKGAGTIEQPSRIPILRREIARIMTIKRERLQI